MTSVYDDKLVKELDKDSKKPVSKEITEKMQKEMAKVKENLEKFSKSLTKKVPYIISVGLLPILPPKNTQEKDKKENKKPELVILFPDDKFKEVKKLEKEVNELAKKQSLDINFITRTPQELWQVCFDGHFPDIERIGMAYPLFDKGVLSALRVATIHRNLVLRKFEKYVTSYVVAGSLVRGQATETSDVDIYVVIDDTDVKRMPRFELRERLRSMIGSFAFEANEIAGAKNKLSPQVYLLTEFWDSVKDANPVIFTFIRDGVPFYDRGAFMPWKLLLKMGKIKPSPEAIDNFMLLGEKLGSKVKADLTKIVTDDLYWGVITPTQAALMLYGLAPPTPLETIKLMDATFVQKEKILEKKYIKILEEIVGLYKDYEHGRMKEITGKDIDKLVTDASSYIQRLKELVKQIEKQSGEKIVVRLYDDTFDLLNKILGKGTETKIIEKFKAEIIDKAKLPKRNLDILKEMIKAKSDYKKGKLTKQEVDKVRKDSLELVQSLIDYEQRENLILTEKSKFRVKVGSKMAELFIFGKQAYLVSGENKKEILKLDLNSKKLEESSLDELAEKLKNPPRELEINLDTIKTIESILGKEVTLLF